MKYLYRLYQIVVCYPLFAIATILASLATIIGCWLGNGHFWGYWPGRLWSWFTTRILLLPVTVEGRENLNATQSYVFVANHQGFVDIFLIYGYLRRNFKWMMKHELRQWPCIGPACAAAHHIFVDKRGPSKIRQTYDSARKVLQAGMSLVVFPEGSRTFSGHMSTFRRGAFMLADDLQLPVVPLTINGSFKALPRQRKWPWITWTPLRLTIHEPIYPIGKGAENIANAEQKSFDAVMSALESDFQGVEPNPDA